MTDDATQIWLKRADETPKAYKPFEVFLRMGADRTVVGAYRQHTGRKEAKQASGYFLSLATKFEWFKRADAYDRHIARVEREAEEKAFAQERRKWAQRRADVRNDAWEDAKKLRQKARDILLMPLTEQKTVQQTTSEDGKTVIQHITIMPAKFSMQDAATMAALADKLSRLATDMETERIVQDSLDAKKARELEDARSAFAESHLLFPKEPPEARAQAIAVAYGFTVEQIMAGQPEPENNLSN